MGTALGRHDVRVRFHVRSSQWGFPRDTTSAHSAARCVGLRSVALVVRLTGGSFPYLVGLLVGGSSGRGCRGLE